MLRSFVVFSLCLVATLADGEFSVLSFPEAVAFKGKSDLDSQYVGDVMNTVMGNPASPKAQWDGLFINDPFSLVDNAIIVFLKGIERIETSGATTYKMSGDSVERSLNDLSIDLKTDKVPICDFNYNQFNEAAFYKCFDKKLQPKPVESDILKETSDKDFLNSISYIQAAAENFVNTSKVIFFHLSLESIIKSHSENAAEAINAASKLAADAIDKLNKAAVNSNGNQTFVVVISQKTATGNRRKRDVLPGDATNKYNLATYYNQDYPVIFNIILWFMVTFGFSLLAICYAIGDMDPGRDSIIYRMTSTRMKKDN